MSKRLYVHPNRYATVDADVYDRLKKWKWQLSNNGYAVRKDWKRHTNVYMHREVVNAPSGIDVDHKNRTQKLNNQRSNIRLATESQNLHNRPAQRNNTSGYKGVTWCKEKRKWQATIQIAGVQRTIGRFPSKLMAAKAYDGYARTHLGEFARLNFPHSKPLPDE